MLSGLLFLVACGDSTVTVTGQVLVKHQLDLNVFEEYYREICEKIFFTDEEIETCVDEKMSILIENFTQQGLL